MRGKHLLSILIPICLMTFATALAAGDPEDETDENAGYEIIDTARVKQMMDSEPKTVLAFAASPLEFSRERIPKSVCIPYELVKIYHKLPDDLDSPLIFYCLGTE